MTATIAWLIMWLADLFVLATLLLIAVAILWPRLAHSADRMAVAWGAFLGLALLVAVTLLPSWPRLNVAEAFAEQSVVEASELSHIPKATERSAPILAQPAAPPPITAFPGVEQYEAASPLPDEIEPSVPWRQAIVGAWLCAAALAGGWLLCGSIHALFLLRRTLPVPQWAEQELARLVGKRRRAPRLCSSREIASAAALGTLRPNILLPESSVVATNVRGIRAALAHEWAHICHGDLWLLAIERLLLPIFCAHPLYWWLRRRVREDQELLADAAAAGEQPLEYAEALLGWAKSAGLSRHGQMAALGMWENPRTLTRRVEMLLKPQFPPTRRSSWRLRGAALAFLLALVAGLSCLTLRSTPLHAQVDEDGVVIGGTKTLRLGDDSPAYSVQLEMKLARVDPQQLQSVLDALKLKPAKEGSVDDLVQIALDEQGATTVWERIEALSHTKIESRPQIVTLSGQPATLQIGGEVPVIEIDEITNGVRQRRVDYRQFGTHIDLVPTVLGGKQDGSFKSVRIEVRMQNSRLLEGSQVPSLPRLSTFKIDFTIEAQAKQTVLVVPRFSKDTDGSAPDSTIVFSISPIAVKPAPPAIIAPNPVASAHTLPVQRSGHSDLRAIQERLQDLQKYVDDYERDRERLKAENEQLRKQLQELQSAKPASQFDRQPKPNTTTAFSLKYVAANEVAEVLRDLLHTNPTIKPSIATDERTNIVIVSGNEAETVFVRNILRELDQPAATRAKGAVKPNPLLQKADPAASSRTAERLKQLDIQEAELVLRTETLAYESAQRLVKKGLISATQLEATQIALERAKINVLRAQAAGDSKKLLQLDLQDAEALLLAAQKDFERVHETAKRSPGAVSAEELRDAELALEKAKINVLRARARLEEAGDENSGRNLPMPQPTEPPAKR